MDRTVWVRIDEELCNGCGLCVSVCPNRTLSLVEGKARITGDRSLSCGHCAAVCPTGAVQVSSLDPSIEEFQTFTSKSGWVKPGEYDLAGLVSLMRSRRSCRNYDARPVEREKLLDLIKIGITAPSGSNSQAWTFTVLPDRTALLDLAGRLLQFFRKLNRQAESAWLRTLLRLLGKPQLDNYYREHHRSVSEAMADWTGRGDDRLFHGAAAAIVVASRPGASCPAEDALLASGQIGLAAHAMGLGACLIGFAVAAMHNDPGIKAHLGIPDEETVHAVIALGYPKEKYRRPAGRRKPPIRFFQPGQSRTGSAK